MHQFHKFMLSWNSTCFGQFLCPSSGVYSLYTRQWYMSYRFVDSFWAGPGWNRAPSCSCSKAVWHVPLLSVQWINSWWWTDKLSEICRVSRQNKFVKLVHLVVFIIKKSVTMYGYMNVKYKQTCWQTKQRECWCLSKVDKQDTSKRKSSTRSHVHLNVHVTTHVCTMGGASIEETGIK
jgi:hypothetical protein